eukprot:TRINITY_DN14972_c0_g1_i1.p1 TRINITY_DN14972_c0_g1~~TRINITY_DN14972_c0_g1_i1.p1  ORF type:complete len:315 (-),score=83.09 TRINITY_DN14972_c0_g1_i1:107-1051(-)
MKHFFFYDRNFKSLRDHMVDTMEEFGAAEGISLQDDFLDDLQALKNRAGGGMPTYLYKAAKICKALAEVEQDEVFLFTDVDVQFFGPIKPIADECMKSGVDMVLQREFDDIGVNIGFMLMRSSQGLRDFWEHAYGEIQRTQALDQRVVNNMLYSGFAAEKFGLRWDVWPSCVWASSTAFSGPLPEPLVVHHANFLVERAAAADPGPKLEQLRLLREAVRGCAESKRKWEDYMAAVPTVPAMLDYRDRHFGSRRPGPEWTTLPEGHLARPGGFSEKREKKEQAKAAAAAALAASPGRSTDASTETGGSAGTPLSG